jgi:uncharacterized protein
LNYIDTSVLVALFCNEDSAVAIRNWYEQTDSGKLVTSDWTLTEFSSAIRIKERTGQLNSKQIHSVLKAFDNFCEGGIRLLGISRHCFQQSAQLIRNTSGLRAGDALHLAVALETGSEQFITLDKLLFQAAKKAKLEVLRFD